MGSRGKVSGQGVSGQGGFALLKLKALFYFKAARMLFSGPIIVYLHKCFSLYKFIIIIHLMTLKSEVAELRYEVAELSSGELRLTFTTVTL